MNKQRVMNAATDCISRFRSSLFPLKNVAADIIAARKLNSTERKVLLDLVFRFVREAPLIYRFIEEKHRFSSALSIQQKDALVLSLLAEESVNKEYQDFLISHEKDRYLLSLGSLLEEALKKDYGDEAFIIAESLSTRAPKYLAFDPKYVRQEQIGAVLKANDINYFTHPIFNRAIGIDQNFDLGIFPKNLKEHIWIMDAGSQIIAQLIEPKPSEKVLDMCAGEGGKAQYITMKDCHYVACDISEARLKHAKRRLKNKSIEFVTTDARKLPFAPNSFDWILLDAPCSGIGVLRRHYDLVYRLNKKNIDNYVALQKELLLSASRLLKPQGKLIYVTCSLLKIENEQQIAWLMKENNQIKSLPLSTLVHDNLNLEDESLSNNSLKLFPHIHNCDGFFFSCMTKND